jgi:DNA-binding CsgD family transcriptional regulator
MVVNSLKGGQTVPEALSSEIESVLRSLARKLETLMCESGHNSTDANRSDNVLLDVEVSEVRLLILRRGRPTPISPREREIARMVARGYANKTIASILEISSWTVASLRVAMAARLFGAGSNESPPLLDSVLNDGGGAPCTR